MKLLSNNLLRLGIIGLIVGLVAGCSATQVLLSKKDLDVQTRTSTAIFVDPVAQDKRTIFLDIRSGVMEFNRNHFKTFVAEQFTQPGGSGYVLVDDPEAAQFQMIVYVLNLEKASPTAAEAALGQGYLGGAVASGAAVGAIANNSSPYRGAVSGGILGGAAEFISGSLVKDVTYMLVADVQIKEKARKGVYVRKDSQVDAKVSDAGSSRQTYSEVSNKKEYRTRIVTTANQANLELNEAIDLMFKKTAYAMAGFF
ncbi:complement resistance protein TraT [Aliikangiella maris]|uniref:Complement resistance protein TraT n=2 Tax=Aliikangiella maris TaxID=3162458 RepID=A0ABV3MM60_9GAMM